MSGKFKTSIGGQALIEGIMMRGPQQSSMAVREIDGGIYLETFESPKAKWYSKIPIVRGVFGLGTSLMIGYKCLMKSAEISGFADEDSDGGEEKSETTSENTVHEQVAESSENTIHEQVAESSENKINEQVAEGLENEASKFELWLAKTFKIDLMTVVAAVAMVFALMLSVVLFVLVPTAIGAVVMGFSGSAMARSITEVVVRTVIFIAYIGLVSLMPDIRRVFEYHGAEHKTIACYEAEKELTVENIKPMSRFHPRCGTSFLFLMLVISVFVSMLISIDNVVLRTLVKILLMAPVAGVSSEIIKFMARHDNPVTRIVSKPGLWLQRLTTKEPSDDQIEVAIAAMTVVIPVASGSDRI